MKAVRVQSIASSAISYDTIPQEFIQLESEQPAKTTHHGASLDVPVINFNELDEEKLVRLVTEASGDLGLFQIVNHEIQSEVITKFQNVGKAFFELPQEEKEKYAKPDSSNGDGYGTKLQKEVQGKKGWVDHLFHKIWPASARNFRFWPENPPSYREATEEYATHLQGVVNKLLRTFSLGLELEGHEMKESLGGEELIYLLKINYYPSCPRPDLALGVVAHTDMCAFTILIPNDVQGLQVFKDGNWFDVEYIPNALIVHVGDQLEILSNGKYKAVLHRSVVNKDKTRMSWPVFIEPPEDKEVGPHPKLVTDKNPAKYNTKTYGEYKYRKLNKLPQASVR